MTRVPDLAWEWIGSDAESRAQFFAALDVAIERRVRERAAEAAELELFAAAVEAAAVRGRAA
ncbi:hypothetical protein EDD93_1044 [Streptomyces sp. 840.1]|uniref:hypothetical protein n=1 Tax=Streptomyces sp. 840.1 TaxID=2485152 RepID=UPI000F49D49C|nr:hypothetical protein [Streptomyces sp. 840.1]ROQ66636.1 hypothetical protein EDD93_1044 [Streptomyces sp. 840.1]